MGDLELKLSVPGRTDEELHELWREHLESRGIRDRAARNED